MTVEERNLRETLEDTISQWRKEARVLRIPPSSRVQQAKALVYEACADRLRAIIGSRT